MGSTTSLRRPFRAPTAARAVAAFLLAVAAASGCAQSPGSGRAHSPESSVAPSESTSASSSAPPRGSMPPRPDLHCTPQATGDEAACKAKGPTYHFGPGLECYGTDPGPQVREAQARAYAEGTSPCTCYSDQDIEDCSRVP